MPLLRYNIARINNEIIVSLNKTRLLALKKKELEKEKKIQQAVLDIKKKFGKNAVLKGMNFEEGATTRDRNAQIGGHKA